MVEAGAVVVVVGPVSELVHAARVGTTTTIARARSLAAVTLPRSGNRTGSRIGRGRRYMHNDVRDARRRRDRRPNRHVQVVLIRLFASRWGVLSLGVPVRSEVTVPPRHRHPLVQDSPGVHVKMTA